MDAPPGGPNWRYSPNKAGCIAASFQLTTPPIHQKLMDPERLADRAGARTQLPKTTPNLMLPVANAHKMNDFQSVSRAKIRRN